MKLKFSLKTIYIMLFFAVWPEIIKLSFFDKLPLEITKNILEFTEAETRINVLSTCHNFTMSIGILKPILMKKIVQHMVLQNVFKGNFGTFDELNEEVKNQLPRIIFNDNPQFKNSYDKMWALYSFCYTDIAKLRGLFEKLPLGSVRLKADNVEIYKQERYKIHMFTYQENNEILYQTVFLPTFNLTSDLAWQNIKKIIEQFPKLKRIVVNEILIKPEEIEKNYPLQYGNIIIQSYPKIESGKAIQTKMKTILHFPHMDYKIFELLLENKIDPNVPDMMGDTTLHCASLKGKLDIVKLLLKHGADPYFRNHMNYTPADRVIWRTEAMKKNGQTINPEIEETVKFWQSNYPRAIDVQELPKITREIIPSSPQEEPRFLNNSKKYPLFIILTFILGGSLWRYYIPIWNRNLD